MEGKTGQLDAVQLLYVAVSSSEVKLVRTVRLFNVAGVNEPFLGHVVSGLQTTLVDLLAALQTSGPFGCAVICR